MLPVAAAPFPPGPPLTRLTDHFRGDRAQGPACLRGASSVGIRPRPGDKEDIARHIRQTVKTFQFLLFEQNRPAI